MLFAVQTSPCNRFNICLNIVITDCFCLPSL